ncbi:MAG: ChbG/HpnK family deacetylase [Bacteroidales bacterium]|nr:ChbG/HpnK family deacetylase [Bacteroidales bacterium]MCM1414494.1 ChbG/HpnK family deacetylase [bacterium]MCM1423756.1 ChbG/HpnK family deacetylase [bacterium]
MKTRKHMNKPDIHADDYALTKNTSLDMLECMRAGKLDSISIVTNMSCFELCMELLYAEIPNLPFLPLLSVHLDFVEGRSLAGKEKTPDLVKPGDDLMALGWGGLFAASYLPGKRGRIRAQLTCEIKAQLARGEEAIRRCLALAAQAGVPCAQKGLRIDSHQHAHMIPVVWEALLSAVREEDYAVEYIRNSKEVLGIFLTDVSLYKTYRPINFVKNRLLSLYSHKVDRYCREHGLRQMYLWGLVMSGRMDRARIRRLYPKMRAKAERDGRELEILFHPGLMLREEVTDEVAREAAEDFYCRADRHIEKAAVISGKW